MIDQDLLLYLQDGFLTEQRRLRFEEVMNKRSYFLTVVAEDVFQMHNTSAVLRSCDAFGIQRFYAIEDRFGSELDKNIAMGAEKWVEVERFSTASECAQHLKQEGFTLVATSPEVPLKFQGQKPLYFLQDYRVEGPTAVLFGTEKEGLSEELLETADHYLEIPMQGFTESFNISVAAALVLYELSSQMRSSDLPWKLKDEEKAKLRWEWTCKSIKDVEAIIERYRGK
ncbi:TrmH family RNA methyltransferase [Aureicoccus marinus]|uniref:tRNA (guanosine(18)-2'-O)-methyltransferase n=1 Tax=Aureicoccus marinus TaxID=754435 RepID=A0A2S7T5L1_9FLAO|nr:RNA methyltransferase [Aureicoccus marinus]PQJ14817.1 rRNA methyltransferase [Aureicoccus marinus]